MIEDTGLLFFWRCSIPINAPAARFSLACAGGPVSQQRNPFPFLESPVLESSATFFLGNPFFESEMRRSIYGSCRHLMPRSASCWSIPILQRSLLCFRISIPPSVGTEQVVKTVSALRQSRNEATFKMSCILPRRSTVKLAQTTCSWNFWSLVK